MYQDTKCRICGTEEETQEHALESCLGMESFNIGKVTISDIFEEDTEVLRKTAEKIGKIIDKFQVQLPHGLSGPADPGGHKLN